MMEPNNPYLDLTGALPVITELGHQHLSDLVTDSHGPVYVWTGRVPPQTVAVAMARLSRSKDDARIIYLKEFAIGTGDEADEKARTFVTGYGDDSVAQLVYIQYVLDGISNVMTKRVERKRLGNYLERSTRYVQFDQRDENGKYPYYVPKNLPASLRKHYEVSLDSIFDAYSTLVKKMTKFIRAKNRNLEGETGRSAWLNSTRAAACDVARVLLPVATTSTVGVVQSAQGVEQLIIQLLSEPLQESQDIGMMLLREARKVVPMFLERADMPDRGGAITAFLANNRNAIRGLAGELLVAPTETSRIDNYLVRYGPHDELDLVGGMLFEESSLTLREIEQQVSGWPDEQKVRVYRAYMGERLNRRQRPGRATEEAHFTWEMDGRDYGTFRDIQRHRLVDAMEWQRNTPHIGYEIPHLAAEAGFEMEFNAAFEQSKELYDLMVEAGYPTEAQYATLLGHEMVYRFTTNLRELFHILELRTGPAGHSGYRKICGDMYEELKAVYPLAAKAMEPFIGKKEDEALSRLGAERATEFKRQRLGIATEEVE